MATKAIKLMHFSKLFHQCCRCYAIAQFPACAMVGLAERADDEAACCKFSVAQDALMRQAVKDDVFVYFVGEHENTRAAHDIGEAIQVFRRQHGTGGIMRRIDQDHPCPGRDCVLDALPVHGEVRQAQRNMYCTRAGQFDGGGRCNG